MDMKLFIQAMVKFFSGLIIIALLLFVPAGTIRYMNGWLLIGILFVPMFIAGLIMMFFNPELLRKRLDANETEETQKTVIVLSALMFIGCFVMAGLTCRFGLISFPSWAVKAGVVIFILSYLMFAEVLRENTFLSRTVRVEENQKVIDTGLYGIVRHPMYAATVFLFLSMPVVLGSPISFAIMLVYIPIINKRMINEEEVLSEGLEGYEEYCSRVKYRVIPFIW